MKRLPLSYSCLKLALLAGLLALLQACASSAPAARISYDFGATPAKLSQTPLTLTLSVAEISAPATLDGNAMLYRLDYENQQQLRPYAGHRWSMPPAQLLTHRLKARIAGAGGTVLSVTDGVAELPVLKIELEEFSQIFRTASHSHAQISLRASLVKKHKLLAQRSFTLRQDAASADAAGGAKAMQLASDAFIAELIGWLQGQALN